MVIPIDRHRRHAWARGELVLDREFVRKGEGRQRIFLDALDADQRIGTQLQSPICRTENVNSPIADQAAAEIVKAAPVERQIKTETAASETAAAPPAATRHCRVGSARCSARTARSV